MISEQASERAGALSAVRLAWFSWAFSVVLVALGAALLALNRHVEDPFALYWINLAVAALALSTVGALVASRRPENPIGWLLGASGLLYAVMVSVGEYGVYALLTEDGSLAGGITAAWLGSWLYVLGANLVLYSFLFFPDGRLPSPRWRVAAWLVALMICLDTATLALAPGELYGFPGVENPFGVEVLASLPGPIGAATGVLVLAAILVPVIALVVRFRGARGDERQQIKWVVYAVAMLVGVVYAVAMLVAAIVAVLFAPLRDRLQRSVNRLMYGERDDPYAVISRLGERLEGTLTPEAVLPTIVQTVREALKLPYAAITLREGEDPVVVAETGSAVDELLRLPLIHHGETIGELILAPRASGEEFAPADRHLLEDLARQAGIAAHAVRLAADLQRSRERLVSTREEERRRLRRDLHDGLGPMLGSLTLKLDVADDLVEEDPAAARALIRSLKAQSQSAVFDIRRLVHALRPPALDDLGLVGAIRETAAQYGANGLRVSVDVPENDSFPPLSAAAEVAAYRIAQEALTNVARHAGASGCAVRLRFDEAETLLLEIADDGRGLPPEHGRGVGLSSMRERAEELGGSCVVESPPKGGARVRASLPCNRLANEDLPPAPEESSSAGESVR